MNLQEILNNNIKFELSNELLLLDTNTLNYVDIKLNYQISAGIYHSMILTGTGELYVAGANDDGELGLGDNENRNTFTLVDVPTKAQESIVAISAGGGHSIILTGSGELYATGNNHSGQLGLGDNTNRNTFTLVDVPAKSQGSIIAISAGGGHSMVLTDSGELYVTGRNDEGQLGLADNSYRNTFTLVDVPTKARGSIVAISAGNAHSMILTDLSEIYVTGDNDDGQLGLADNKSRNTFTLVDVSAKVRGLIIAISAGSGHSMVLTDTGELYVTGANDEGQLGLGDNTDRNTFTLVDVPAKVRGLIIAISAGSGHSMVLTDTGKLPSKCLQYFDGRSSTKSMEMTTGPKVLSSSSASIRARSLTYDTGRNYSGQLGLGDNTNKNNFTLVDVPAKARRSIVAISAGYAHSMILTDSSEIYVTGGNYFGQLGLADNSYKNIFTLAGKY